MSVTEGQRSVPQKKGLTVDILNQLIFTFAAQFYAAATRHVATAFDLSYLTGFAYQS